MRATILAASAFMTAILTVIASPSSATDLIPFKVGEAAPANTFLAIWVAQAAGFYESQGLKLEIVPMVGGRDSGPALKSGRVQLIHIGLSSVVRANLRGGDLRSIGSLSNIIRATMFAGPQIKTNAELKGKAFGISSEGSESDSATTLVLRRIGLSRADVTVKEIGVERLSKLRSGEVAATLLGEPQRTQAFGLGLRVVADLYAERIPWLYSGLTVDRAALTSNRDAFVRFLRATIEGNHLAISDAARAKEILAKELKLTDPKVIDASYANFKAETPPDAEIDRTGAENVVSTMVPPGGSHNVDDYVDTTLTDGLRAQGFMAAMATKYGQK